MSAPWHSGHTAGGVYARRDYALRMAVMRRKQAEQEMELGYGELMRASRKSMRWWALRWRGKNLR